MSDEWDKLVKFVHEMDAPALFGRESKLTHDMDLYHDLDWNTQKIEKVIAVWAEQFDVDISNFDISYYIPSARMRNSELLWATLKSPFSMKAREILGGRVLTLGMMEEAMRRRRWIAE